VNVLTALLPGARHLRAPLAIGYLWLLVAWINAPRLSAEFRHSALVVRATQDIRHLTPVLIVLIVSFGAYVLGLFFEIFDELLVIIGVVGLLTIGLMFAAVMVPVFLLFLAIVFSPIVVPLTLVMLLVPFYRSRRHKTTFRSELAQESISDFWLPFQDLAYSAKNLLLRMWSSASVAKNELVSNRLAQLLEEHPEIRANFCDTVSVKVLRIACSEAGLKSQGKENITIENGSVVDVAEAATRSSVDPQSEKIIRRYLLERLETSREVTRSVVLRVMNTTDIRELVNRAFDDAEAWLRAEKPRVFEEYDRLRSEGEFRRGIAVPLGAALISLCVLYTSNLWVIIAAAGPLALVYISGMRKQENAARVIASSVNAGIATIQLDVTNVRLLKWPTDKPPRQSADVPGLKNLARSLRDHIHNLRGGRRVPHKTTEKSSNDGDTD